MTYSAVLPVNRGGTASTTASAARAALSAAASGSNSDITALSGLTTALSLAQGGTNATTASGARTQLGAAASGSNSDITSLSGLTTALSIAQGGTNATTASGARTQLSAAASGSNSDITALSGLTTALSIAQGGTNSTTASGARTALSVPLNTNTMLLDGTQAMAANLPFGGFKGVNAADPTAATDIATKNYVDNVAQGLSPKPSAMAGTTAALSPANTYANGTAGVGATLTATGNGVLTVDGYATVLNDYVLVQNEAAASHNGLYKVTTAGTAGVPYVLTRALEMDDATEYVGAFVFVEQGTVNASAGFVVTTTGAVTPGTTAINFTQFSGAGSILAGSGLSKTGNTLAVVGTSNRISVGATVDISAAYVGQTSITTLGTITTGVWNGTSIAVANGGTGSTTASGARSALAAAPNTATYLVASSNGELANADVATAGSGILITLGANTATFAVDTSVVVTLTGTQTLSNKTLTSPTVNNAKIIHTFSTKTGAYTLVLTDDTVIFNISSGAAATLPTAASASGQVFTIKNRYDSTANCTVTPNGAELIDGAATNVLLPGDSLDILSDGTRWNIV